jgi:hypothetical protein
MEAMAGYKLSFAVVKGKKPYPRCFRPTPTVLKTVVKRLIAVFFYALHNGLLQGDRLTSGLNKIWKGVRQEASGSFSGLYSQLFITVSYLPVPTPLLVC